MAQAVKRLYPDTKLAIGPSVDNGFYYDFDSEISFTPEILEKIEAEMKKIVKEGLPLERYELDADEAIKLIEVDFRSTAENFSKYFFDRMSEKGYDVRCATVYETPNNCASYYRD